MDMWQFIRDNSFIVGAFSGGVAAFLLKLLADYLQREKKWIGYSISSRRIVEKGNPNLSINYKNLEIKNLTSHSVLFRNIGNRPLKGLPIRISLPFGGQIVEYEIQGPDGAEFACVLESPTVLRVDCDLLNKQETFIMGVTAIDTPKGELLISARGENLICKEISPQAKLTDLLDVLGSSSSITKLFIDTMKFIIK